MNDPRDADDGASIVNGEHRDSKDGTEAATMTMPKARAGNNIVPPQLFRTNCHVRITHFLLDFLR